MEQLREELLAADTVALRRLASLTLAKIMAKRLDPRYRRVAIDTLRYLDEKERQAARVELETYRALTDRLSALDDAELALERRTAASSPRRAALPAQASQAGVDGQQGERKRPSAPEDPRVTARRRQEIEEVVEQRRRARQIEDKPLIPAVTYIQRDELPKATQEDPAVTEDSGFRRERVPGRFGKGAWKRVPVG
jgi:hypothetical protein